MVKKIIISSILLFTLAVPFSGYGQSTTNSKKVIIIGCGTSNLRNLTVKFASISSNSLSSVTNDNAFVIGAECADALVVAFNNNYKLRDISSVGAGTVNSEPVITYTLIRKN